MKKHLFYLSFSLFFGLLFAFSACNNNEKNNNSAQKFFRYNQASGISSLDPAFAKDQANIWAINQLFNGLVQMDNELNIKPCLAKSWTISDDGLTYTFSLRNDVYFHDHKLFENGKGRKLNAADVAYSFNRLITPKTASEIIDPLIFEVPLFRSVKITETSLCLNLCFHALNFISI